MLDARFSHLYFCQSLNSLQRGLSAIAELLVIVTFNLVYMQLCLDKTILCGISQTIRAAYPSEWLFEADWALIATWHDVTFFGVTAMRPPVSNTSTST